MQLSDAPICRERHWILKAKDLANGSLILLTEDITWAIKTAKRANAFATLPAAVKRKPGSTIHSQNWK